MKKWFFVTLFLVMLLSLSAFAKAGMRVVYKLEKGEMTEMVCEDGLFRFGNNEFYTIWDADRGLVYYVMPKEKRYSVMTVEEARQQAEKGLKQMEEM
jgi:hypothetical protein